MKIEYTNVAVEILGKTYPIRCLEAQATSLQRAADYLNEKMCGLRNTSNTLNLDRIAIITALNITHDFLALEYQKESQTLQIDQRLQDLQSKIEVALSFTHQEHESANEITT